MKIKNTDHAYGWLSIILHWIIFILFCGMFGLGLWMVNLDYYDDWYKLAPYIHKSIGMIVFIIMIFRYLWKLINTQPKMQNSIPRLQQLMAKIMHHTLYLIFFVLLITGYFIATADGHAVDIFGWGSIPSTVMIPSQYVDTFGDMHFYIAWLLVMLICIHAFIALKHHFYDKDNTLLRMLGINHRQGEKQ